MSMPWRRRAVLSVFAVAAVFWAAGGRAADPRPVQLTASGYTVPVYGSFLERHADGSVGTRCGRLSYEQIQGLARATTTSAALAWSPRASVRASAAGITFRVVYTDAAGAGFNDAALGPQRKAAFEAALAGWSRVLAGTVPVVVEARMGEQGADTLASAGPTDFVDVGGKLTPFALAAQLRNGSVNGGGSDIGSTFNQTVDWDYAPNGVAAAGKVSFVYTALHELGHGLGFLDTLDPETGATTSALPTPYDAFINRGSAGPNPVLQRSPDQVKADVVSGDLFFAGPNAVRAGMASIRPLPMVKLYAPSPYEQGSSVSHVDQDTYADIRVGLMVPRDFGPGFDMVDPLTAGFMADLGYQLAAPAARGAEPR